MSILNDSPPPCIYICTYRDGKRLTGLSYSKSLQLFNEALGTDNPCSISLATGHFEK